MSRMFVMLLIVSLGSASSGAAASLALSTSTIGAQKVSIPRCTAAGIGAVENLSASNVVSVTLTQLANGCGGATAQISVNNGSANSSGTATVPAGGGSVTVTLSAGVAATAYHEVDLVLTGP